MSCPNPFLIRSQSSFGCKPEEILLRAPRVGQNNFHFLLIVQYLGLVCVQHAIGKSNGLAGFRPFYTQRIDTPDRRVILARPANRSGLYRDAAAGFAVGVEDCVLPDCASAVLAGDVEGGSAGAEVRASWLDRARSAGLSKLTVRLVARSVILNCERNLVGILPSLQAHSELPRRLLIFNESEGFYFLGFSRAPRHASAALSTGIFSRSVVIAV